MCLHNPLRWKLSSQVGSEPRRYVLIVNFISTWVLIWLLILGLDVTYSSLPPPWWFWYTVKKASPWVVVRHANSMVPHDKFSIPDGDGPMCCHSKAPFQLQKRNIVTTKVRVRFCVENDFWWDAFLHTARIWCDGQEAAAAIFLFILIRALFSLYCSWAPLLFSVMLTPLVNVF